MTVVVGMRQGILGPDMAPDLSVIVCTLNRPREAARAVAALAKDADGAELIVVDQSEDAAFDALAAVLPPAVTHLRAPPEGLPAARNLGGRAAKGAVLLFLDDDAVPMPGWIAAHRRVYADPSVGGAVGRTVERRLRPNLSRTGCQIDATGRSRSNLWGREARDVTALKGANMSVRRAALAPFGEGGPFDVGYGGTALLEDADIGAQILARGHRLRFVPDAEVVHLSSPSGGVRRSAEDTQRARFRNTGRYLGKHRHGAALALALAAQMGIAAWSGGHGARPTRLVGELWRGVRDGRAVRG